MYMKKLIFEKWFDRIEEIHGSDASHLLVGGSKDQKVVEESAYREDLEFQFDHVVGNPPYQEQTVRSGKTQGGFWWKFLEFCLSCNPETLTFVTPPVLFGMGNFGRNGHKTTSILDRGYGFHHINPNTKEHFPGVGIETCHYHLRKGYKGKCSISTGGQVEVNKGGPVVMEVSDINQSIFNKCFDKDNMWDVKQTQYNKEPGAHLVFDNGRYKRWKNNQIGSGTALTNRGPYITFPSSKVTSYRSMFKSKLFEFIFKILGGESGNSPAPVGLPTNPGDHKKWTDQELYKHYKLTQREINHIEEYHSK